MKKFDHIKVADYSLGATYICKWIKAFHDAVNDQSRASSRGAPRHFKTPSYGQR